jgi:DNA-binding transcriptional LysR family regulator
MKKSAEYRALVGRLRMRHFDFLHRLSVELNLGRVAKHMNMTQPTASKLLQEIENVLGCRMFIRNRRGMSLTLEGQVVARRASILLADLRATHDELISVQHGSVGRIRLGVFPVAVTQLLPQLIARLDQRWPGVCVALQEGDERSLSTALSEGRLDCVLGRVVPSALTTELAYRILYNEPSVVVASANHPIAKATKRQVYQQLSQHPWLMPYTASASSNMLSAQLANLGLQAPRVVMETISVFVTLEMLKHQALISILPKSVAQVYAAEHKLVILPVELPSTTYPVGVIYRKDQEATPLMDELLSHIDQVVKERHENG